MSALPSQAAKVANSVGLEVADSPGALYAAVLRFVVTATESARRDEATAKRFGEAMRLYWWLNLNPRVAAAWSDMRLRSSSPPRGRPAKRGPKALRAVTLLRGEIAAARGCSVEDVSVAEATGWLRYSEVKTLLAPLAEVSCEERRAARERLRGAFAPAPKRYHQHEDKPSSTDEALRVATAWKRECARIARECAKWDAATAALRT